MTTITDVQASFTKVYGKINKATGSTTTADFNQLISEIGDCKAIVVRYGSQGNVIGSAPAHLDQAKAEVNPTAHTLGFCERWVDQAKSDIPGA